MRDLSDREIDRLFELDDAPGPARPVDSARAAAIVAGALARAGFPPSGGGGGGGGGAHAAASHVGAARRGPAIKLAIVGGAAAVTLTAIAWLVMRAPREAAPVVAPPAAAAITPSAPTAPAAAIAPPAATDAVAAVVTPPPVANDAVAAAPAAATPPPVANDAPAKPSQPTAPPRQAPSKIAKPHVRGHRAPPRAEPARIAAAPDDLLAEANAARVAHRWRDADALYSRVVSGGQDDLAVQAALVASASLRLEHLGDPAGAARRFRAALAAGPGATLAEDARWGVAESARALADPAGELRALDDFLAHHAGSARAGRARARRAELGAPP
jgi:hypothetical protein